MSEAAHNNAFGDLSNLVRLTFDAHMCLCCIQVYIAARDRTCERVMIFASVLCDTIKLSDRRVRRQIDLLARAVGALWRRRRRAIFGSPMWSNLENSHGTPMKFYITTIISIFSLKKHLSFRKTSNVPVEMVFSGNRKDCYLFRSKIYVHLQDWTRKLCAMACIFEQELFSYSILMNILEAFYGTWNTSQHRFNIILF